MISFLTRNFGLNLTERRQKTTVKVVLLALKSGIHMHTKSGPKGPPCCLD